MKKTFALRDLEKLSGIKAHTLRMWEKRYTVLNPHRTAGNKRIFSIDELSKILNYSLLNNSGIKISVLAKFSDAEVQQQLIRPGNVKMNLQKAVIDMIIYMYKLDIDGFESVLNDCFSGWSAEIVVTDVIYQFLFTTGLIWKGNRLTEEHFAVTSIRVKMIKETDNLKNKESHKDSVLLFLPGRSQLDLLLLYANYIFRLKGFPVLYMGNDVSLKNLKTVIDLKKPKYIFTYFNRADHVDLKELSSFMNECIYNPVLVVASDKSVPNLDKANIDNIHVMTDTDAIDFICSSNLDGSRI